MDSKCLKKGDMIDFIYVNNDIPSETFTNKSPICSDMNVYACIIQQKYGFKPQWLKVLLVGG